MAISEINDKSLAASAVNLATNTVTGVLPTANVDLSSISGHNLLYNGANAIWQRGTSWSSGVNRYVHDRWYQWGFAAIPTQQAGINGIGYATRLQHNDATANSFSSWNQSLETSDTVYARGNKTTFSVYIKKGSAFTGTLNLQIVERTDAEGSVNTGTRNVLHSENIAGSLTTSFQRFTITSNNNVSASAMSIGVNIDHGGTSGTDSNNYFEFTQAQLEVGTVATTFEHRSYGQELALCERYCTVYNTNGEGQIPHSSATVDLANRPEILLLYPKKRANPSIAVVNPTNFKLLTAANTAVVATGYGGTYLGTGLDSAIMFWNVSSGVSTNSLSGIIQQLLIFQNTGSITIDAEL
jgi:hypothetical protein